MVLSQFSRLGNNEVSKWINVKDKLPEHHQVIMIFSESKHTAVCIFIDNEKALEELRKKGFTIKGKEQDQYSFCSQEIKGNIFSGITHWRYLPKEPQL